MMRLYYLRNACTSVQTIAAEVSHLVLSRYKSPMRAVACAALLCGTVTMPGALTWDAKPEVFSHVEASSAIRPVLGATMPIALPIEWTGQDSAGRASIAKSFSGFVSKPNNSPLSAAAPFVSPEADSGSYAGRTEGSLRDTLARAGVPVEIREQIAGIFAARLDVAATAHEGDAYRVLYKRDDAAAQRKRVTAVELRSGGKVYQAVWFVAPGRTTGDYFSFDGQRLAAELFAMPLDYVRVSSPFGYRDHPVKGKRHIHTGVDFAAPKGTQVVAAAAGIVQFVGFENGYGKYVVLSHPQGYTTYYAHLSAFARDLRVGAPVTEGQPLGTVGSTGTATGPHLHFEVRLNNHPTDPLMLTSRTGALLLTADQRVAFDDMTGSMRGQLAGLPIGTPTVKTASNAGITMTRAAHPEGSLV
jgi:murein DD-endopeptidase MepM/ murein hydrolase activator NlpD